MAEAQDVAKLAYEAIELAKKSGKLRKGINEVTKAAERSTAKLVIIAKDVNPPEVIMHVTPLCNEKNIPVVQVPSKDELGAAAGLSVGTSAIAIIQEGDAAEVIKDIVKKLKE